MLLPVTHQHPNVDWNQERARYRQVALRQLANLGVTDIESRIRFERVVTPADWESKVDIYRGATFNLAHSFSQMLHLVRKTGSRSSTGCTWSAAARIPAAACPSSSIRPHQRTPAAGGLGPDAVNLLRFSRKVGRILRFRRHTQWGGRQVIQRLPMMVLLAGLVLTSGCSVFHASG